MRIALVGASLEENLALAYIAAPLRSAGHEVSVIAYDDAKDGERVVARLQATRPAVIGMSVAFQHRLTEFRDLSRELRVAGVTAPIVWGGHIPTARPGQILERYPEVDVIVRHDGEQTMMELVEALDGGPALPAPVPGEGRVLPGSLLARLAEIDGLAFRVRDGRAGITPAREAVRDLSLLDLPARDGQLPRHAGLGFAAIVGSRGCWQHCTYCSIHTYHRGRKGPRVRLREPASVAAEMADLYERKHARIFCFHDENFFLPKPAKTLVRLHALRAELDRRGVGKVAMVAKCRPDELSPELLQQGREMGVVRLYVGVENGSQNGLDHLGRDTTVEACSDALGMLREAGVYACFNVLLFEPDTTLDDVRDNIAFLGGASDFPWNFCRTEVYPGSVLEARLREQGRLRGGLEGMSYTIADPDVELLFRMTAVAFGGRNFGPQSTANLVSGLGYVGAVLEYFHPGRAARAYRQKANDLTQRFCLDTLDKLERAYTFVRAGDLRPSLVRDFTAALARDVAAVDAQYWPAFQRLRLEMDRYGAERAAALLAPRAPRRNLARAAAIVAAAGLSASSACTDDKGTLIMDPLPGDIRADAGPDILVMDPLPWDIGDAGTYEDIPVMDPLPPDVMDSGSFYDVPVVDPLPPDVMDAGSYDDIPMVDPVPPDVMDSGVWDPLPEDIHQPEDVPVMDPLPPDVNDGGSTEDVPVVDPPPPDVTLRDRADGDAPALATLDRSFRVRLVASEVAGATQLIALTAGAACSRLRWHSAGGRLTVTGNEARFEADGSARPLVIVTAEAGEALLDVARFLPDA